MKFEDRIQLKLSDLTEILQRYHHIPEDVVLVSDSGWEGGQTSMDGIYYNQAEKNICFTHGYGEECTMNRNGVFSGLAGRRAISIRLFFVQIRSVCFCLMPVHVCMSG